MHTLNENINSKHHKKTNQNRSKVKVTKIISAFMHFHLQMFSKISTIASYPFCRHSFSFHHCCCFPSYHRFCYSFPSLSNTLASYTWQYKMPQLLSSNSNHSSPIFSSPSHHSAW